MCVNQQCVNVADVIAPDCGDCSMNGVSFFSKIISISLFIFIILYATVRFRKKRAIPRITYALMPKSVHQTFTATSIQMFYKKAVSLQGVTCDAA